MSIHRTGSYVFFLKNKLRTMWFSWYDITGELSVLAVQQNGWWFLTQLVSHVNHHTLRVPFFMWSNSSNPGGVVWSVFNSTTEFLIYIYIYTFAIVLCFQNFYIIRKCLTNNFDNWFKFFLQQLLVIKGLKCHSSWFSTKQRSWSLCSASLLTCHQWAVSRSGRRKCWLANDLE